MLQEHKLQKSPRTAFYKKKLLWSFYDVIIALTGRVEQHYGLM